MVAQQPASPSARRLHRSSWLDLRLVTGVLLVLVSVLLGARVVASADQSVQVWAVTHDISAGTTLTAVDVRPARVRLFDGAGAYLRVVQSPAGRTVTRHLHAGELLPRSAVIATPPGAIVNIPIQLGNAPELTRGELVDIWAATKGCAPVQVLARVPVQDVRDSGGALAVSSTSTQVIVRVSPAEARRAVVALSGDSTIRLVVLDGDLSPAPTPTTPVERCVPTGASRVPYQPSPTLEPATPPAPRRSASGSASGASTPTPAPSAVPTSGSR